MRILFVASLHHPKQLQAAVAATPPGATPPLFPPSMSQHHWELALRRAGHDLAVSYRNGREQRHTTGMTPEKVLSALQNRLPPQMNPDKRARNAQLIDTARAFQPDVLWLVGDNTVIYPETLQTIKRETGCVLVYASGTSPIVFSHQIERDAAPLYDLVLVNDFYHGVQWLELGAARAEALPISGVNPDFHRRYDAVSEYACDVAFVGTLVPDHLYSRRVRVLEALRDFDLGIWSVHEVPSSLKPHLRGSALGETAMRVMSAAKLCVNIHGNFMHYGGNMRTFEAAGVGVCQIADDLPGTKTWFTPGEQIVTFTDLDDLRAKVTQLLADDARREAIAQAGQQHAYTHHNYDQRVATFETILEKR